eukprot:Lithocolla_globosa_v1_NODE_5859_length_1174_cov_6.188561.p3 type:complete len:119 gc:universal NODE_5859_length_1174_cov_6.188561:69-425(+)
MYPLDTSLSVLILKYRIYINLPFSPNVPPLVLRFFCQVVKMSAHSKFKFKIQNSFSSFFSLLFLSSFAPLSLLFLSSFSPLSLLFLSPLSLSSFSPPIHHELMSPRTYKPRKLVAGEI